MAQLRDKDYATKLREQGAAPVVEMGAVFDGKRVWVAVAEPAIAGPVDATSSRLDVG